MAQENVEIIRRVSAAYDQGDREGWARLIADDAVLEPDQSAAQAYEVRGGQITRLTVYVDRAEAREAVGLPE